MSEEDQNKSNSDKDASLFPDEDQATVIESDDVQENSLTKGFKLASKILLVTIAIIVVPVLVPMILLLPMYPAVGEIAINTSSLIHNTFFWGSLYLSLGMGLTLTYKIQKFANFAHGEYFAVGAYAALFFSHSNFFNNGGTGVDKSFLFYALIIGFLFGGMVAAICDKVIFKPLRKKKASDQSLMITSLGLSLVLRSLIQLRFGGDTYRISNPFNANPTTFNISTMEVKVPLNWSLPSVEYKDYSQLSQLDTVLIFTIFVAVVSIFYFMKTSKTGKAMRAVSSNSDLAASSGINVETIHTISAFIAGGLAGLGGALYAMRINLRPDMGLLILLPAFAVIVLGTVGSLLGALIAAYIIGFSRVYSEAILIGLGEQLNRPFWGDLKLIAPFIVLIFVLLFYAEGIGKSIEAKFNAFSLEKFRENMKTWFGNNQNTEELN